jgi:glycosyltransferase involved in cell wall biosynthesis
MRVLSCQSPYGQGGVGQHFAHLVEEAKATVGLSYYLNSRPNPADGPVGRQVRDTLYQRLYRWTPLRYSIGWSSFLKNDLFDRRVANTLDEPAERFMGFVGQSLHSFRRARSMGFETLELVAVNSHVDNVQRLHDRAAADWQYRGISWLNEWQREKTLAEYDAADRIFVHSEYTRDSFLAAGIPASKLERTYLRPDPRFVPPTERPDDGIFRVVYVGRVDITKGLPVLLEAFQTLPDPAELTIVGGWPTRQMKQFMHDWIAREPRLRVAPGDPLPALHAADVFVHPSYEDGFGYAPMEALACGVPTIVTEDTGMKEYVTEGVNGYVIPTGDVDALANRLHDLQRHPLRPLPLVVA